MKEKCKKYRDAAKFIVFSNIANAMLAVILSELVTTLINFYYQYSAVEKNVNIFSPDVEMMKVTLTVMMLSFLINLPLSFCGTRFYLIMTRKTLLNRATLKDFFAPFSNISFLLKGSAAMLLTMLVTLAGTVAVAFNVYVGLAVMLVWLVITHFTYCMTPFFMSDDPQISPIKAMTLSRRMMKGKKILVIRTVLPIILLYSLLSVMMSSLFFLTFFVLSTVRAVFNVAIAIIYEDTKETDEQPKETDEQ